MRELVEVQIVETLGNTSTVARKDMDAVSQDLATPWTARNAARKYMCIDASAEVAKVHDISDGGHCDPDQYCGKCPADVDDGEGQCCFGERGGDVVTVWTWLRLNG